MDDELINDCERRFGELSESMGSGDITEEQFADLVGQLKVQDQDGVWWQMSPDDGKWAYWTGSRWIRGGRPRSAMPPAGEHPTQKAIADVLPEPPPEPSRGFMGNLGRYGVGGFFLLYGLIMPFTGIIPNLDTGIVVGHLILAAVGFLMVAPPRWLRRRRGGKRS